ncbi:hypothetical protein HHK36_004295 [Tetracentron sinense]|uniref:Lipase-like PAD4 n=1 Tax=Tetracentron sinense TaxID=13715 RepID=A0A835DTA6_TETSI|nr:hypothetical protein HHK36_004295 [Tetracentron sinense]
MEAEASMFETSEMLAGFLASTSLLSDSWRRCSLANTTAPESFVVDQAGDMGYVAFSGIQTLTGLHPDGRNLVQLHSFSNGLFASLRDHGDGEEPVMVHGAMLRLFLSIYNCHSFQNQFIATMEKSKVVIITGHSIGGTTASLAALWLLSYLQSVSSSLSVLCITFGSPLLGNESLSKAILRERWGGNFVHVVSKHDIVPRLLFTSLGSFTMQLSCLVQFWHLSMTSPEFGHLATQLTDEEKTEIYHFVLDRVAAATMAQEDLHKSSYRPFGSYVFCSEDGAICVENSAAIIWMLYLMFKTGSANSSIEDHLKYGDIVGKASQQFLKRRSFTQGVLPDSCYEVGISLALEASGIVGQDCIATPAKECLRMAKRMGRTPNLNSATLAIGLAKVTPHRAQIEWYKASCDDQMCSYYDSFKLRGASRRDSRVNMNRIKLAQFWDNVIHMLDTNQLPYDFHHRAKWVMASHSYKLLVEPLDIAEYYRTAMNRAKGHYLMHGRERRYEVFERWWRERKVPDNDNKKRTKYAGLTQDSCFWARVEEAREWLENARNEKDAHKLAQLWENNQRFELYATRLVDSKEVSRDVVAKNSSYGLWVEEWKELKSRLRHIPPQFPDYLNGGVVP